MSDPAPTAPELPADRKIDLDEARRARREKQGAPPSIVFLGEDWPLPRGFPAEVLDLIGLIGDGDTTASTSAVRVLLGGEVYDAMKAKAVAQGDPLDLDDVVFLLEQALDVYGVTLPESEASPPPS